MTQNLENMYKTIEIIFFKLKHLDAQTTKNKNLLNI